MSDPGTKWIEDAIADGFEEVRVNYDAQGEPYAGALTKGDVVVHWDKYTYIEIHVWFSNGRDVVKDVPEVYNNYFVDAARGRCTDCGESGDPARLKRFRFVERLCPTCDTPSRRAEGEFDGWCD